MEQWRNLGRACRRQVEGHDHVHVADVIYKGRDTLGAAGRRREEPAMCPVRSGVGESVGLCPQEGATTRAPSFSYLSLGPKGLALFCGHDVPFLQRRLLVWESGFT